MMFTYAELDFVHRGDVLVVCVCRVAKMMQSCLAGKPERSGPVVVEDIKRDLLGDFSHLPAQVSRRVCPSPTLSVPSRDAPLISVSSGWCCPGVGEPAGLFEGSTFHIGREQQWRIAGKLSLPLQMYPTGLDRKSCTN